jgi:pyridoxamine 5'-phosphate oxidase family protein
MSVFTPAEIAYLNSQRLGRLATANAGGQPHVVPVAFRYNPDEDAIEVGGYDFATRKKWRDVQQNDRVAFVVDDLVSADPWRPRMLEVRGRAEILEHGGGQIMPGFAPQMFRIRPRRIVSYGLDAEGSARSVPRGAGR